MASYVGRFAPTPSGPLHEGSLVAALASWLDARAHGGRWLVRIEDLDTPRNELGAEQIILGQLAICGMVSDEEPLLQSTRLTAYEEALVQIAETGLERTPHRAWPMPPSFRHRSFPPARPAHRPVRRR